MKIIACSIVKNEAQNIERSIESYKGAVDEILIVDTGSTDNTVDICKAHGAKVLYFEWCNDFAAAKNFALENAKGDWIIFLDADEWFVPKLSRSVLLSMINKSDSRTDGIITTMYDLDLNFQKEKQQGIIIRIFRCSTNIRYYGNIHEKILKDGKPLNLYRIVGINIYHSGYDKDMMQVKGRRNLDILKSLYNAGEITTELYFYLSRENCNLENIDDAVKFYDLFMRQHDVHDVIVGNDGVICIFQVIYFAMSKRRDKFSQAEIDEIIETAYNGYPMLPIHSFMIGNEKLMAGKYAESFEWISRAIDLNEKYSETYTNIFVGYLSDAYYKLGYIRRKQNRLDDTLLYYIEAVNRASQFEMPFLIKKLINLIEAQPQEEIILFLNNILDMEKKYNVETILGALKNTRLHKAFVYYAIKYNQEFDGQDETTYIAMILMGQAELAVETAVAASKNDKEELAGVQSDDKGNEANHENWQMDYAVVAVLYSKSSELFEKYREHFNPVQREIIEAYLDNFKLSEDLKREYYRIKDIIYYLLDQKELLYFIAISE